ncbi:DUF3040 domain-containing protein [Kitasatospora purpeofusca]|uniref:DUF3040 domain-containing protein n=1 Tax=Kitasatospora purpeofusca TaxID=67352 RepID=UPI0036A1F050
MDGPALSDRERRILAEIEGELRTDRRLDRRLRTMRRVLPARAVRSLDSAARVPVAVLVFLAALSLGLLMVSASVHTASAAAFFAVVWLPSALLLLARLCRRARRRPTGASREG